ncbi:DUF3376 domain-containing protein [Longispora sp. K20-0274]|uniref:DUF3376 domain-containing protein n=1 Tax=Longispora sp. K20-0274 TaxID=3088255 RepID=UPI0039998D69
MSASADHPENDHRLRTLRIALALRGGVSLAVWIGGAVAEIDVLRRTDACGTLAHPESSPGKPGQEHRARIYADLLRLAGYSEVKVDVLAGASAGGLNSLLYGLAQSVGATVDDVEDVWRDVAGMWSLMRPTLPIGRVPSLLRGDQYFYPKIREQMYQVAARGDLALARRTDYLTVDLSATLLDADGLTESTLREGRGQFRFARRPAPLASRCTDLPGPGDVPTEGNLPGSVRFLLDRLALAARSTSSFPGAFEPASVHSVAECDEGYGDGTDAMDVPVMTGVFSGVRPRGTPLHGAGARPFYVVDGGVFDNVPIDRALRSINLAPASEPTDRRLLYLEPDPTPPPVRSPRANRSAPRWLAVIARALALKISTENTYDELRLVREHNEREVAARGRQDALARQLGYSPATAAPGLDVNGYASYRATTDVPRLAGLLTRPGEAGLGKAGLVGPYQVLDEPRALELMTGLDEIYRGVGDDLWGDVQGVYDTATLFVAWVRELEERNRFLAENRAEPIGMVIKNRLYRILRVADVIRSLADREFLRAFQGQGNTSAGPVDLSAAVRRGLSFQRGLDPLPDSLRSDLTVFPRADLDDRAFFTDLDRCYPRRGAVRVPCPATPGGTRDERLLDGLWQCLDGARAAILEWARPILKEEYPASVVRKPGWERSMFPLLHHPPLSVVPIRHVHTVFAATGVVPGTASVIRYHCVAGSQPTPLAELFTTLVDAERGTRLGHLLRGHVVDPGEPLLTARSKLAGVNLGHFGGFLARSWRANDWTWGRLDAASALVDVLIGEGRPDDAVPEEEWREWFRQAWLTYVAEHVPGVAPRQWNEMIAGGPLPAAPGPGGGPPVTGEQLECLRRGATAWLQYRLLAEGQRPGRDDVPELAAGFTAGGQTMKDLRPVYRFGLATRAAHLAYRALWPARWSWRGVLTRMAMMATRPLLTLAPLLVYPARAAAVAMLLVLAVTTGSHGGANRWLVPGALLAAGLLTLAGQIRAWYVWRGVRDTAAQWHPDWGAAARSRWRRVWPVILFVGWPVGAGLLVFGLVWARTTRRGDWLAPSWPEAAVLAAVVLALAFALFRLPYVFGGAGGGGGGPWRIVRLLPALLGLAAALSPPVRHLFRPVPGWLGHRAEIPYTLGMVLLVAALSWLVLWGWSRGGWAAASIVAVTAAAGALAWTLGLRYYPGLVVVLLFWIVAMSLITLVLPERKRVDD